MAVLALVVSVLAGVPAVRSALDDAAPPVGPSAGAAGASTTGAAALAELARYHLTADPTGPFPGALRADNPAEGYTAWLGDGVVRLQPTHAAATVGNPVEVRFLGVGAPGAIEPLGAAEVTSAASAAWYARSGVTEWYHNDTDGLELGFTVTEPVPGTTLAVELAVTGATPVADGDRAVDLQIPSAGILGQLRWEGLLVTDHEGLELPARFVVGEAGGLRIEVDTTGATYPITVDPTFANRGQLDPSTSSFGTDFGAAMDSQHGWIAVGAPDDDTGGHDQGAVHLYRRVGTAITLERTLTAELTTPFEDAPRLGEAVAVDVDPSGVVTVAAGRPGSDISGVEDAGGVVVWTWDPDGALDDQQFIEAPASGLSPDDQWGQAVAVDEGVLVVGAPRDDGADVDQGRVDQLERPALGAPFDEDEAAIVEYGLAAGSNAGKHYGASVAVDLPYLVIGIPGWDDLPIGSDEGRVDLYANGTFVASSSDDAGAPDLLDYAPIADLDLGEVVDIVEDGAGNALVAASAPGTSRWGATALPVDPGQVVLWTVDGLGDTGTLLLVDQGAPGVAADVLDGYGRALALAEDFSFVTIGTPFADAPGAVEAAGRVETVSLSGFPGPLAEARPPGHQFFGPAALAQLGDAVAVTHEVGVVAHALGALTDAGVVGGRLLGTQAVPPGIGTAWSPLDGGEIDAPFDAAHHRFGTSVDVAGDTVVIGEPDAEHRPTISAGGGAVVNFLDNCPPVPGCVPQQLPAPNLPAEARFGAAVAASPDGLTVAVGAPFDSHNHFGGAVAAPGRGAVWIYVRPTLNLPFVLSDILLPPDITSGDQRFGSAVAFDDTTLYVGAPATPTSAAGVAAVYAYDRAELGVNLPLSTDPAPIGVRNGVQTGSQLGLDVDVDTTAPAGLVAVMELIGDDPGVQRPQARLFRPGLTSLEATGGTAFLNGGYPNSDERPSVSIEDGVLAIGSPLGASTGTAEVFDDPDRDGIPNVADGPLPPPSVGDRLGTDVEVTPSAVLFGQPGAADPLGTLSGAVLVGTVHAGSYSSTTTTIHAGHPRHGMDGAGFGTAVAADGSTLFVGAPGVDVPTPTGPVGFTEDPLFQRGLGTDAGRVYVLPWATSETVVTTTADPETVVDVDGDTAVVAEGDTVRTFTVRPDGSWLEGPLPAQTLQPGVTAATDDGYVVIGNPAASELHVFLPGGIAAGTVPFDPLVLDLGRTLALDMPYLVAAANVSTTNVVRIYEWDGATFQLIDSVAEGLAGGGFGDALAVDASAEIVVVGAPSHPTSGGQVSIISTVGSDWQVTDVLEDPSVSRELGVFSGFGASVAAIDLGLPAPGFAKVFIGAPDDRLGQGAVYVVDVLDGTADDLYKYVLPAGVGDNLGAHVAAASNAAGDTSLVVSADRPLDGLTQLFVLDDTLFHLQPSILAGEGYSVAAGGEVAAPADGRLGGFALGTRASAACTAGDRRITGLDGANENISGTTVVVALALDCASGGNPTIGSGGIFGGSTVCPGTQVAVGIQGREGDYLDSIQLVCQAATLTGARIPAVGVIGGGGGDLDGPYLCPDGQAMVGLDGRVEGTTIRDLEIRCETASFLLDWSATRLVTLEGHLNLRSLAVDVADDRGPIVVGASSQVASPGDGIVSIAAPLDHQPLDAEGVLDLLLSTTTPTSPPGLSSIPLADLPSDLIGGTAANGGPSAANGAIASTPLRGVPLQSVGTGGTALAAAPLQSVPLQSVPLRGVPLIDPVLKQIRLSDVPIDHPGGWAALLDISPARVNQTSLYDALGHDVTGDLTLAQIDLTATPLRGVTLAGVVLGHRSIASIPIGDSTDPLDDWCAALDALGYDCLDDFGIVAGQPETAEDVSVLALNVSGVPLQSVPLADVAASAVLDPTTIGAIPLQSVAIEGLALASTPLQSVPLQSVDLEALDLAGVPLQSVPLQSVPLQSVPLGGALALGLTIGGIPLQSVPLQSVDITGTPLQSVPLQSVPLQSVPLQSVPLQSVPLQSVPLRGIPLQSVGAIAGLTIGGVPLQSVPLQSVDILGSPLQSVPLQSVPLQSVPLQSVPLQSVPLQSVPLVAALEITLGATPLQSVPLQSVDLLSSPLRGVPLQSVAGVESIVDCTRIACHSADKTLADAARAGLLLTGATLGDLGAALSGVRLGELAPFLPGTTEHELLQAWMDWAADKTLSYLFEQGLLDDMTLGDLPLDHPLVGQTTIGDLLGDGTPTGLFGITLGDLVDALLDPAQRASAQGDWEAFVTGDPGPEDDLTLGDLLAVDDMTLGDLPVDDPFFGSTTLGHLVGALAGIGFDVIGALLGYTEEELLTALDGLTLGDLADSDGLGNLTLGDLTEFAGLTLGELLAHLLSDDVRDAITLGDILLALISTAVYPWESLDIEAAAVNAGVHGAYQSYVVAPQLAATEGDLTIRIDLPEGARYVPGSASATGQPWFEERLDGADPTFVVRDLPFGGSVMPISFLSQAPLTVGTSETTAVATITSLGTVARASTFADVTEAHEPDDTLADADAHGPTAQDTLTVGHVARSGDVDLYPIDVVQPGGRLSVALSNLPADLDLALYAPAHQGTIQPAEGPAVDPIEDDGQDPGGAEGSVGYGNGDLLLADLPLLRRSRNPGTADERIDTLPLTRAGRYYVQVTGHNGATSPAPYSLRVRYLPPPPPPTCVSRDMDNTATTAPSTVPPDATALLLVNDARLRALYPDDADPATTDGDDVLAAIESFVDWLDAHPELGIVPAVLHVDAIPGVAALYDQWDAESCSPDRANQVVAGIVAAIQVARTAAPGISHVVPIGSDSVIPSYRTPDATKIANETGYAETFVDPFNPDAYNDELYSIFAGAYVQTDDPYGDRKPQAAGDRVLFVPDAAVGRLVETPGEITAALAQFTAAGGVLEAESALVTGYDFLTDGADLVTDELRESLGSAAVDDDLVSELWDAADLDDALLGTTGVGSGPDIASVNAHYDHFELLPGASNALEDQEDLFTTAAVRPGAPGVLQGSILFSMGCHGGLSVPDTLLSEAQITHGLAPDWAQTFSAEHAVFVGNTGYGYGDTEAIALSERLMALFASRLDGTVTVGEALLFAKNDYAADFAAYGVYDEKALHEATFYGLPFYRLDVPNPGDPYERPAALPVSPDPVSGIASTSVSFSPTFTDSGAADPRGRFWAIEDADTGERQVQAVHYRPLQPQTGAIVTQPDGADHAALGRVAHGALLTGLTYDVVAGVDPAVFRPIADDSTGVLEPAFNGAAWPQAPLAVQGYVSPAGAEQQLNLVAGRYESTGGGLGRQLLYTDAEARVLYADPSVTDFRAPTIVEVGVTNTPGATSFVVTVDPGTAPDATEVARVLVLVLPRTTGHQSGVHAVALDLARVAGTDRWTGSVAGVDGDVIVQAADAAGNVAYADDKTRDFEAVDLPAPVPGGALSVTAPTPAGAGGWHLGDTEVTVSSTDGSSPIGIRIDGGPHVALDGPGPHAVPVTGTGVHVVTVSQVGHPTQAIAVAIDAVGPEPRASIADGEAIPAGSDRTLEFTCVDAGSGLDGECTATLDGEPVASGASLADLASGEHTFTVTAPGDVAGNPGASLTRTFRISAPAVTVLTPVGGGGWHTGPVELLVHNDGDPAHVTVDGVTTVRPATPDVITVSGEGEHAVDVRDGAGELLASLTVRIDSRPPEVAITVPADGAVLSLGGGSDLVFTCADPAPGSGLAGACTATLDGAAVADGAELAETPGDHTVVVTAPADVAGNAGTSVTVHYTVVDPAPPVIETLEAPNGVLQPGQPVVIHATYSGPAAAGPYTAIVVWDDGSYSTCTTGAPAADCTITSPAPGSPGSVAASHAYAGTAGQRVVEVRVSNRFGSTASREITINRTSAMTATPIVLRIKLLGGIVIQSGSVSATLTDAEGEPLAGRSITFRIPSGQTICTATTDSQGRAACNSIGAALLALLGLQYEARFAGDQYYRPITAVGPIIKLL